MEKITIEELVKYIVNKHLQPENTENYVDCHLNVLKYNGFPVKSMGPLSLEEIIHISFIIGLIEGAINADVVKIEGDNE